MVIFDDFLRDVEAQTCAAPALTGSEIRLEDFRHLSWSNPAPCVLHADIHVKILAGATHRDGAATFSASLHGVHDNILDRTLYLNRITHDGTIIGQISVHLHSALRSD